MVGQNFIIILLSSGVISALVSSFLQKKHERETRIFTVKLQAYIDFTQKLLGIYDVAPDNVPDILELDKLSSEIILIAPKQISEDVKKYNRILDGILRTNQEYKKMGDGKKKEKKYKKYEANINKLIKVRDNLLDNIRIDIQTFLN